MKGSICETSRCGQILIEDEGVHIWIDYVVLHNMVCELSCSENFFRIYRHFFDHYFRGCSFKFNISF